MEVRRIVRLHVDQLRRAANEQAMAVLTPTNENKSIHCPSDRRTMFHIGPTRNKAASPATQWSFVPRFSGNAQGQVSVEYALLLGIVTATVLFGALTLGAIQRRSLEALAPPVKSRDGNRSLPADSRDDVSETLAAIQQRIDVVPIVLSVISIGLLTLAWHTVRRVRKQLLASPTPEPSDTSSPVAAQARYVERRQYILRFLRNALQNNLGTRLAVRHVMTQPAVTAPIQSSAQELLQIMAEHGVWQVIICDDSRGPVGIVNHRYLKNSRGKCAGEIMSSKPITVPPEMDLSVAITLMLDRDLSCLPVVCDGKLQGVLTTTELAMGLQALMQFVQEIRSNVLV